MSAHTPGPWGAWQPLNDGSWAVTAWEAGDLAAGLGDPARLPPRIADEIDSAADARLIAAAPELLALLRECLPHLVALQLTGSSRLAGPLGQRVAALLAKVSP